MPLTTDEAELLYLESVGQELADRWGEPHLLINEADPTADARARSPYTTPLSQASAWERSNHVRRIEPRGRE